MAFSRTLSTPIPAPSSETSITTWLPSCSGPQRQRSFRILACGLARIRRLNAVIERVAHRMCQRVLDGLKQALVQLRLLALHLQPHSPPSDCERSRTMRGIFEKMFETGCMRAFITLSRRSAVTMSRRRESSVMIGIGGRGLQHLVARQHQFAHQVHHSVQQRHIDAQRALRRRAAAVAGVCCLAASRSASRVFRRWRGSGFLRCLDILRLFCNGRRRGL